jgi:hypothetical protein
MPRATQKFQPGVQPDLGIHEPTVKLHCTSITTKLGVPSLAEPTRLALDAVIFPEYTMTFPKGQ